MKPKPSLRRDSLERAAMEAAEAWNESCRKNPNGWLTKLAESHMRLAKRHGAKVRRETLKEAAALTCYPSCFEMGRHTQGCKYARRKILSLTPRGPEKGRRAK